MGAYIGIEGKAKKVLKGYIGVPTRVPIYETTGEKVTITVDNISEYFNVTNSTYYFAGSNGTWTSNNKAVGSSTAQTVIALKSDGKVSFNYTCSSETNYDKLTITTTIGGTTTTRVNAVSGVKSGSLSYSMSAGDSITFKYVKDSSANSNSDICTFSNLSHDTTQKILVGYEEKELAKRIRKAYVGVGGKAKFIFGESASMIFNTTVNMVAHRAQGTGSSVGNYGLMIGGNSDLSCKTFDAYNEELTRTAGSLSIQRHNTDSIESGGYAFIAGGYRRNVGGDSNTVDAINENLSRSSPSTITNSCGWINNANINNEYALICGGYAYDTSTVYTQSIAYNASTLAKTTLTDLPMAKKECFGGNTGNKALIIGNYNTIDVYDTNLSRSQISTDHYGNTMSIASSTKYIFSCVGKTSVDVYDEDLTVMPLLDPLYTGAAPRGVCLDDDVVVFSNGTYYDKNLTRCTRINASEYPSGGVNSDHCGYADIKGKYAIFGEYSWSNNRVFVYEKE